MATLNFELGKAKQDGSHKVAIILSHKGKRKRLPTNILVDAKDISRNGNITSRRIQKAIDNLINVYRDRLYELEVDLLDKDVDIDWIFQRLQKKAANMDFFSFASSWIENSNSKSLKNYKTMLNSLRRYTKSNVLPFSSMDVNFIEGYNRFLRDTPRAQSLYLGEIRHLYNEATRLYNNEYERPIPLSPFTYFKIAKHVPKTKDRVVSEEDLVKIFRFEGVNRIGLARDCYILSFFLIGMNSVDLYACTNYKKGVLSYERAKTKDRRIDNAYIEIEVPDIIKPLFKKYKGKSRVFDFYTRYTNEGGFNKHLNAGLKIVARKIGIPPFDFYSARHTWASIARNKLGIDKYTIHEALNHVSDIDITDIYIQRDFTNINRANKKVVDYFLKLLQEQKEG